MANLFMRFPEGKTKAVTLSYDDGVAQDIRLIEIMKKYGLKGTFNINSGLYTPEEVEEGTEHPYAMMKRSKCIATYKNSGMEVALHGLHHPCLDHLPYSMQKLEIMQDRINLEKDFETIVRGMAYPYGNYNDEVVQTLRECGVVYSRTCVATERFEIPSDWLRMPTTCHHDNPRLMELAEAFLVEEWNHIPKLFYLWGHSYEFDMHDNWNVIEEFAQYIGNRENVWYATNIEIYEYVEAYRKLIFSTDGKLVYNPTGIKVYFQDGERVFCVKPGETLAI